MHWVTITFPIVYLLQLHSDVENPYAIGAIWHRIKLSMCRLICPTLDPTVTQNGRLVCRRIRSLINYVSRAWSSSKTPDNSIALHMYHFLSVAETLPMWPESIDEKWASIRSLCWHKVSAVSSPNSWPWTSNFVVWYVNLNYNLFMPNRRQAINSRKCKYFHTRKCF